jgi:chromatin remodeling complex protein RSC6
MDEEIKEEFSLILLGLGTLKQHITKLQNNMRGLEKSVRKRGEKYEREKEKREAKKPRRLSGFAVPTRITEELCEFMGVGAGTKVARTEVTQYIIEYIRENELQEKENRKNIVPDSKLKKLLNIDSSDEINYFNIQRYMNKHFIKGDKCVY